MMNFFRFSIALLCLTSCQVCSLRVQGKDGNRFKDAHRVFAAKLYHPALRKQLVAGGTLVAAHCAKHVVEGLPAGIVFWTTYRVSLKLQQLARISNATPILSPLVGLLTISIGNVLGDMAADEARLTLGRRWPTVYTAIYSKKVPVRPPFNERFRRAGVFGPVVFKLLGGEFWRLSPSHLAAPGAFSVSGGGCLPAVIDRYATTEERSIIHRLGELFGCHTCGKRIRNSYGSSVSPNSENVYISDHQPPVKYLRVYSETFRGRLEQLLRESLSGTKYLPQSFYPQCGTCSASQAASVRANRRTLVSHELSSIRKYHLTGFVAKMIKLLLLS